MTKDSGSLKTYIAKRVLMYIPLILIIITFCFILIHIAPGDPLDVLLGEGGISDPGYVKMMKERYGLDKPIYIQLIIYLKRVFSGDLGRSYYYEEPVLDIIMKKIQPTLMLMGTQLVLATLIGIILGVTSSKNPYTITDNLITSISVIGYSVPGFWIGQLFLLFFSIQLDLFPVGGMYSLRESMTGIAHILDLLHHLALPFFSLLLINVALITRLTRASMLEVLRQDFILTARSKGLYEKTVVYKHALRNALLPIVTIVGIRIGFMFAGTMIIETIFSWPGLGRLVYDSILMRDYPMLMGGFIITSTMVIFSNIIIDILYGFLDPRIRLGKTWEN